MPDYRCKNWFHETIRWPLNQCFDHFFLGTFPSLPTTCPFQWQQRSQVPEVAGRWLKVLFAPEQKPREPSITEELTELEIYFFCYPNDFDLGIWVMLGTLQPSSFPPLSRQWASFMAEKETAAKRKGLEDKGPSWKCHLFEF